MVFFEKNSLSPSSAEKKSLSPWCPEKNSLSPLSMKKKVCCMVSNTYRILAECRGSGADYGTIDAFGLA